MDDPKPVLVLYAGDIVVTRQCYETLGLDFVEEKHDKGPVHYACALPGVVIEIYPMSEGVTARPCESVALILYTDAFEDVVAGLKAMELKPRNPVVYIEEPRLRATSFRDPDGRLVRLLERPAPVVQ